MTWVIAEPCIGRKEQTCVEVCPVDCIYETERMLVIDPDECIECGACEAQCPVDAIYHDSALPYRWRPFAAINAAWQDGGDRVDALLTAHGF